jgi:hypothetical protein
LDAGNKEAPQAQLTGVQKAPRHEVAAPQSLLWHVQEDAGLMKRLASLPVDISVGHLGYMPAALGVDHAGFQAFLAIVREGRCWVKLTGSYRITALKGAGYWIVVGNGAVLTLARFSEAFLVLRAQSAGLRNNSARLQNTAVEVSPSAAKASHSAGL